MQINTGDLIGQNRNVRSVGGITMGNNFIKGAIKHPGALRAELGAKPGKPIPSAKLDAAAKKKGKLGQRARFAETLRSMQ